MNCRAQQRLDQLFGHDLTRYRFRDLHHGCEVELFDRRANGTRRSGPGLCRRHLLEELVELPDLAIGAPATQITCSVQPRSGGARVRIRRKAFSR